MLGRYPFMIKGGCTRAEKSVSVPAAISVVLIYATLGSQQHRSPNARVKDYMLGNGVGRGLAAIFVRHCKVHSKVWCVCFMQMCKAKEGVGHVESDENREVTSTRQKCKQTQRKWLNIKSDISVKLDVSNRRLVTKFPKVELYYGVDWSR